MSALAQSNLATEFVDWPSFIGDFKRSWRQGEHITVIGGTGSGKTTLALNLLHIRSYVMILATKKKDEQLDALRKKGYHEVRALGELLSERPKVIYRPTMRRLDKAEQVDAFKEALDYVYDVGRWCLFADEVRYLTHTLRLSGEMELLWLQGRSLKISIVAATQRPFHIPLEAYSQATHLFLYRDNDARNIKRLSEISGDVDHAMIRSEIQRLPRYHALYINARDGAAFRTMVPKQLADVSKRKAR